MFTFVIYKLCVIVQNPSKSGRIRSTFSGLQSGFGPVPAKMIQIRSGYGQNSRSGRTLG